MAHINEGRLEYEKITRVDDFTDIVYQANYLASRQDEHRVDDFIAGYTGLFPCNWKTPPCSHTEIGFEVDGEVWYFSSTSRNELGAGQKNGTRWVLGKDLLRHPDRWIIQEKKFKPYEIINKVRRANSLIGQQYDFVGVVADFTLPVDLDKVKKTIYCSKAVHFVDTGKHKRISPRRRWKWAKQNGWT